MLEECKGYVEGSSWIDGGEGGDWGYPELTLPPPNPTEKPLAGCESPDYAVSVKAALCGLARDDEAIKDYVAWTLYEYASFLRRGDENWDIVCDKHTQILKMDTADNTDLQEIEDAIDLLEEDLGDVAEERVEAARDVCDGSSGRAREWIAALIGEREVGLRGLCSLVVEDATVKLNELRTRRLEEASVEEPVPEEELAKDSIADEEENTDADGEEKKEGGLAAASQATEETEDDETKEKRRETEENIAMSEEEVKEKER